MGKSNALVQRGSAQGNERQDIERTKSGMNAAMVVQVDEFGGFSREANCSFNYGFTPGDERDDTSIMVGVAGPVENERSWHARQSAFKRIYTGSIPAF